jgi:O-antigen/teichoic acid export membrane protein
MIITSIPFVYDLVTIQVLQLPADVRANMYWAFVAMIPWPGAIGYRRYYQGVLIRAGRTRRVAIGTGVRLIAMALSALILSQISGIDGALLGTCSLSVAVIFEMLATQWMARHAVESIRGQTASHKELTTRAILRFHAPLALTTAIGFLVTPLLTFFIGRAPDPLLSLAVLPVVDSFIFVFRSFGFSYQEAALALMGQRFENYDVLRRTGRLISMITTGAVLIVTFTPIAPMFFTNVYGLSAELAARAILPSMILAPLPAIAVLFSLQRGVLMTARQNSAVVWSTFIEVGGIILVMILMTALTGLSGAIGAAVAMMAGRLAATGWMGVRSVAVRVRRTEN